MSIVAQQPTPNLPRELELATERSLDPSRLARTRARLRGGSLDRALIAGADPTSRPELAARTALLASARSRRQLAGALDGLLAAARGPHRRWWALARYDGVLANSEQLHSLAQLLDSDAPVYARGVALLRETLADGTGPAYRGGPPALAQRLRDARIALDGDA
jgi:hypothetical protein